ncbi:MAG: ABC transporter substrate-binding protein [Candidatus Rokubacteria bacterium]|nr:ABC transporter substrate-binding protein [Candidatus Rokubacteria bacterium]
MREAGIGRRTFLKGAGAATGAAALGFPLVLRAQPREIRIGAVHPVTGPLAEIGQACRLGAQMAAEAVNAAGGIKSLGGARLALLPGDSESKPDVARAVAERLINDGAVVLTGAFHSGHTMAMVPVAQQRRVPFLVDISAADVITLNVAQSVKEGKQKTQYVYRNFPTTTAFGRKAVQFMNEIFKATGTSPRRAVLMYTNDPFGKPQSEGFVKAHKELGAPFEIVEVIGFPEVPSDLSTEVSKAKAAKPDLICPITRPASATLLLRELAKQRVDVLGVISPGAPGLYEKGQIDALGKLIEYTMDNVPWVNPVSPKTRKIAEEYARRSGGKIFDTNSGYSYEAITIIADVLERARSTDPDAVVEAIRATSMPDPVMVAAGPVRFNEVGDNANASTAMIQILGQKPLVVHPKESAEAKLVFPAPKFWERG